MSDWTGRNTHINRNQDRFYEFEPGVLPPNRYRRDRRSNPISTALWIGGGVLFVLFMLWQIDRCAI